MNYIDFVIIFSAFVGAIAGFYLLFRKKKSHKIKAVIPKEEKKVD